MDNQIKMMKDVVARLREESVGALLELFELDVAVGEMTLSASRLSAGFREVAAETALLADAPALASPKRLRNLADYARNLSANADAQAAALAELARGLTAWSIR